MAGTYIITTFVFNSVQERLDNQLISVAKAANNRIVAQEEDRLTVLLQVSRTEGMPKALLDTDYEVMNEIVEPIAAINPQVDSIIIIDDNAREVFNLERIFTAGLLQTFGELKEPIIASNTDFSNWDVVERILTQNFDDLGNNFVVLTIDGDEEPLIYTVGPIWQDDNVIGVALVGSYLQNILTDIKQHTQAEITFYQPDGTVIETTFGLNTEIVLSITPDFYTQVIEDQTQTHTDRVTPTGEEYEVVFSPFRLRNDIVGVFSVGLPTEFVVRTIGINRNRFIAAVFAAIVTLFIAGFIVTQQILKPIARLVKATDAIAEGDLSLSTGIKTHDEIGRLATSFDQMTVKLRKRTEELEEETSKVRAILSSIADGVLVLNRTGDIIEKNPAADEILLLMKQSTQNETGSDLSELNNQNPIDLLQTVGFEETKRFEIGDRTLSTLASPVVAADQQTLGSVLVLRDITLEVQAEKQKNTFIELISHELRVPLIAMKGYLDLLKMVSAGKLDERQTGFVEKVNQNREDLDELIATLIDTNEIEATGTVGREDDEDIGGDIYEFDFDEAVMATIEERWEPRMIEAGITFSVDIQANELTVTGDEKRLKRVVGYLLDNALKYTYPDGRVELHLTKENNYARIDVTDTGVGITEEAQKNIFVTRFFRSLHPDFYEVRGFGLGLYISRIILEKHGGHIWFKSKEGEGSTFSLKIPLTMPESVAEEIVAGESTN